MAIIKKNISFIMQLDGITINDITSLRENPSSELLQMHQDGRLGRWLRAHNAEEERNKLNELILTGDQVKDLAAIFEILGIDRDIDDIRSSLFINTGFLTNTNSSKEIKNRLDLVYFIQYLYIMKGTQFKNIDFINKEYISLKISTKEYLNKIIEKITLFESHLSETFYSVKQIKIDNIRINTYIFKLLRCIFGSNNDLKYGEKHIDSPKWDTDNIITPFFGRCILSSKQNNKINLYINNIYFPIQQTYDPDTVCFILKKICDFTGDIKIKFQQKDTSPQDAL